MNKENVIVVISNMLDARKCDPRGKSDIDFALEFALQSIEKLQKIEQIINDPLVKARGSIGTNKIREILGEEGKPCQMQ